MPRLSAAARDMTVSGLTAAPEAPAIELPAAINTPELEAIYRRLAEANPSQHLFSAASEPLMVQLARHIAMADKLTLLQHHANDPGVVMALAREQRAESASIASLSTKLKLTPSAISQHRGDLIHKPSREPKPWEWSPEHDAA